MDLFSTNVLTGTINLLAPTPSFLLDTYFPGTQIENAEEIHFDIMKGGRRLAPFVSPVVAGKVMSNRGFQTKTFKPAYVKPKFVWTPNRALKRMAGEALTGSLSPMQRLQALLAQDLLEQKDMVRRRMEVMGSEAMRTGKITVSGDQYPTTVVDFGRDAALTFALTGVNRWGQAGIDPLKLLKDWSQLVLKKSGAFPRDVTMDLDSWNTFCAADSVKARLGVLASAGQLPINQSAPDVEGAMFMGSLDGFNFYVYSAWYEDDAGNIQPMLPTGTVLMGSRGMQGVKAFGAIQDEEAGLQAQEYFTKSWVDKDPGARQIMTQSAPLVVPQNVDGGLCATVL